MENPPSAGPPSSGSTLLFILAGVGLVAVIGLIAIVWSNAANRQPNDGPSTPPAQRHPARWEPVTEDDFVCDRFMKLRAAADPAATDLLGRVPIVPEQPFATEAELERMETDFYLRDPKTRIRSIGRGPSIDGKPRYIFTTTGNLTTPRLPIQRPNEVERPYRIMVNVNAIVEVRDGKLFGIKGEWVPSR